MINLHTKKETTETHKSSPHEKQTNRGGEEKKRCTKTVQK